MSLGSLQSSLGSLTTLTALDFYDNQFTGLFDIVNFDANLDNMLPQVQFLQHLVV